MKGLALATQVCQASHRSRAFERLRSTYGQSSVGKDGTLSGWLTDNGASLQHLVNPYSLDWRTADMQVSHHDGLEPVTLAPFLYSTSSALHLARVLLLNNINAGNLQRLVFYWRDTC